MTAAHQTSEPTTLNAVDHALIGALTGNVRRPTSEIAEELGISTPTVKRRIERMLQNGLVYLGPVIDLHAAGYEYLLTIAIKVEGRSPLSVATEIAELDEALTVNVVVGQCDIEMVAALKTREAVSRLLSEKLAAIRGVAEIAPALALEIWKFQSGWLAETPPCADHKKPLLDTLDMAIVNCLRDNVRNSNRAIAEQLSVSESAVRSRIKRMIDHKQLSLSTPYPIPQSSLNDAFIGIRVQGGATHSVCQALVSIEEVSFVCTCLGRHDIICCIHVTELEALTKVLHEKIISIPGVKSTSPSHCIKQLKHQSLLGLIV